MQTLNQTTLRVAINGQNYSPYVQFPFKVSNLLDEQLDEASLTLIGVSDKIFKPLTSVNIMVKSGAKEITYSMLVAEDKSDEIPSGSKIYKHELYLIEQTKFLECFVVRNLGYVNPLERNYLPIETIPQGTVDCQTDRFPDKSNAGINDIFNPYITPKKTDDFYIYGLRTDTTVSSLDPNYNQGLVSSYGAYGGSGTRIWYGATSWNDFSAKSSLVPPKDNEYPGIRVYNSNNEIVNEVLANYVGANESAGTAYWVFDMSPLNKDFVVRDLPSGLYRVVYKNCVIQHNLENIGGWSDVDKTVINATYYVVVDPIQTKAKWNARTVIRRALICAETLRKGEEPRFRIHGDIEYVQSGNPIEFLGDFDTLYDLRTSYPTANKGDIAWVVNANSYGGARYVYNNGNWSIDGAVYPLYGTAKELQSIETPEFQFTQSTLRELLQEVGRYIHAEPRLVNGDIMFDKLGSGEISTFNEDNYASKSFQQGVDRYATNLYSTVNNLVNSISYANGVIVEPYANGFKTVRTEDVYVRLEDTNVHISTLYPIRSIKKLECGLAEGFVNQMPDGFVDITSFVYESAEYQRMSSYEGAYPMAKAWALYYTIGQKGVYGLNFKESTAILAEFKRYAIVNILNAVTGNTTQTDTDMTKLAFRITYEPIYSATAQQNKAYIGDLDVPATMVYNQGQNLVESHYFGENMKGAIARLGNVDKVQTYVKNGLFEPPQVGQILLDGNEEYYISAVATEYFPFYTKFSMSLSKDFNRYSDYIKVNSEKRLYEVSEKQAFDSHITYKDYVVIGDNNYSVVDDGLAKISTFPIRPIFTLLHSGDFVSVAKLSGYDSQGKKIQEVILPVQRTALGNSALFTVKYKDNYSAGDNVVPKDGKDGGNNSIINYWQNGVAYSDYFGDIEYLDFELCENMVIVEPPQNANQQLAQQTEIGNALPMYNSETVIPSSPLVSTEDKPLWIKKGSTEIPTLDYQVDFVTNRPDIIIGSTLAKNLPALVGSLWQGSENHSAILRVFPYRLNKFDEKIDIANGQVVNYQVNTHPTYLEFETTSSISGMFQSWAIYDNETRDFILGCNKTITNESDIFNGLKLFIKHDIFKNKINN